MARAVILGIPGSPGVGLGHALIVAASASSEPSGTEGGPQADPAREAQRLGSAFEATAAELTELAARIASATGQEVAAILDAQALIALDPALCEPALDAVSSGVPAEEAAVASASTLARTLESLEDERFRARAADVRDVGQRIARRLGGRASEDLWNPDGSPAIIVAEDLAPSATATLRPDRVSGLALAAGAVTGHAAIVARALGLPLVLELGVAVLGIAPHTVVIVDGGTGRVLVDPEPDEIRAATIA
jgi:phosphoenolpyruvate-protein kinase (PTS system EI component)